jgi:hypothetical protein
MTSLMLRPEQDVILGSYWPYGVTVHYVVEQPGTRARLLKPVSGLLTRLSYAGPDYPTEAAIKRPGQPGAHFLAHELVLELYALEDLPQLGRNPLEQVVRRLHLWGTRFEQYVQVRVLDSWLNHLTLEVRAGDYHHQVKLSSWGDVLVRDVRADRRAPLPAGQDEVARWTLPLGQHVLDVYELLRRLHVAVGPVADCQQTHREGKPWGEPEHYVRKALPVQEEVTNG